MRRPSCRAKSLAGRIHGFARRSVVHIAVASPDMDADSAAFWTETRQGKLLASMEQNLVSYFIRRMHPSPLSQHNATEQGPVRSTIFDFSSANDQANSEIPARSRSTARVSRRESPSYRPYCEGPSQFWPCSDAIVAPRQRWVARGQRWEGERTGVERAKGKGEGKRTSTHGNAVLRAIPLVARLAAEPLVLAGVGEEAYLGRELLIGCVSPSVRQRKGLHVTLVPRPFLE